MFFTATCYSKETSDDVPVLIKANTSLILCVSPVMPTIISDTCIHVSVRKHHPPKWPPWPSQIHIPTLTIPSDHTSTTKYVETELPWMNIRTHTK